MSQRVRFNYDLLTQCIERDKATVDAKLYNKDTKLNRDCVINGVCNCGNEFSKTFRYVYEKGGMFCKECVDKERGVSYDIKLLRECSERDEAKLDVSIYNDTIKLNRESSINFICQCNTSCTKMFRCIYEKGGMFCEQCTIIYSVKKFKQTCEEKYGEGNTHPMKVEQFKEKSKQTLLIRSGFDHNSKDPNIKEKKKQTNRKKYGSNHHMQNADVAENASKKAYNLKEYKMPSGEIRILQGYENLGMDILLKMYQENDIITSRKEVPELWWTFEEDNTRHRHYVDFYLPSIRKCIEIKSTWTYDKNEDKVLAKQTSAKKDGFSYEIWIFDKKETLVKKIV